MDEWRLDTVQAQFKTLSLSLIIPVNSSYNNITLYFTNLRNSIEQTKPGQSSSLSEDIALFIVQFSNKDDRTWEVYTSFIYNP